MVTRGRWLVGQSLGPETGYNRFEIGGLRRVYSIETVYVYEPTGKILLERGMKFDVSEIRETDFVRETCERRDNESIETKRRRKSARKYRTFYMPVVSARDGGFRAPITNVSRSDDVGARSADQILSALARNDFRNAHVSVRVRNVMPRPAPTPAPHPHPTPPDLGIKITTIIIITVMTTGRGIIFWTNTRAAYPRGGEVVLSHSGDNSGVINPQSKTHTPFLSYRGA